MIRIESHGLAYYQFEALRGVQGPWHAFFSRLGGVSRPPYATLNVGLSVGDDPAAVAENRRRCFAALGAGEAQVVSPHQVHGTAIARVGRADGGQVIAEADGLLTGEEGTVLFLRFADCVPILLYDRERRALGLVHAGWQGTLAGIAGAAVAAMQAHYHSRPGELWAGIGPAIGPCCYQVGPDLGERFAARFGGQVLPGGDVARPRLDLAAANVLALREAGVCEIEEARLCTACRSDEFFSHRRDGGRTGRLAALAGLRRSG